MGPPGSGKGTQAKRISEFCKIPHISTGEILRQAISAKDHIARCVKAYMNKGKLVPDEIIYSIVRRRLKKADARKSFVLDGFPRNVQQAEVLEKMLGGNVKLGVFNLEVKTSTIIRRLSKRRICKVCGHSYHMEFQPPKFDEKCDRCDGDLYQRDDDKAETIKERLKVYVAQTEPLIKYYAKKKLVRPIEGMGSIDDIFGRIKKTLEG